MLKVLYVSAAAERGGVEAVLLNLLRGLDRSRFVPQVLLLENGPLVREVESTKTETHVITCGRVREFLKGGKAVAKAMRLIRSQGIHIVHNHNSKAHIYGGLAAAVAGVPALYHLHGVPRLTLGPDGFVSLLSMAVPARQTVACSAYVAAAFGRAWATRRKVVVVHNGQMLRLSSGGISPSVREEFGLSADAPLILMACRLQRWKGVHVFLDAAAQVLRKYPNVCFMIVGGTLFGLEQDYELELRQQVIRLKLGQAVRFTGFRSDVFRFYSAADIVVHCSIQPEPFGMVLLEAMAHGKPVVASDSGGPREIVDSGVTGLLVPPQDAESLARAILVLLGDHGRGIRMGKAGAARLQELFSTDRMVQQLQGLYEEMVVESVPA